MSLRRFEVERFSVVSLKTFDEALAGIEQAVGHPNPEQYLRWLEEAPDNETFVEAVHQNLGPAGLMQFARYDLGAVVQKGSRLRAPRSIRLIMGNPLIMRRMVSRVPDAGSYAPVTVLIDERPEGVTLSYDRMQGFLAPYANEEVNQIAAELDAKVENLLLLAAK